MIWIWTVPNEIFWTDQHGIDGFDDTFQGEYLMAL